MNYVIRICFVISVLIIRSPSQHQSAYTIEENNEQFIKDSLFDSFLYGKTWTIIDIVE